MNKFFSLCAVSGLFLLGHGCSPLLVPCTEVYAPDSPQCNPQQFPLTASKPALSLKGDQVTVSIPPGQGFGYIDFETDGADVYLIQFVPNKDPLVLSSSIKRSIIAALDPHSIELTMTADQLKIFSAGMLRIHVVASEKSTYVDVTLQ